MQDLLYALSEQFTQCVVFSDIYNSSCHVVRVFLLSAGNSGIKCQPGHSCDLESGNPQAVLPGT